MLLTAGFKTKKNLWIRIICMYKMNLFWNIKGGLIAHAQDRLLKNKKPRLNLNPEPEKMYLHLQL